MECSKCGYRMRAGETACPCCGRQHAAAPVLRFLMPARPPACARCGLIQEAGGGLCRSCGRLAASGIRASDARWTDGWRPLAALLLAAALVLAFGAWCLSAQQAQGRAAALARLRAEAEARAREARLTATLARLRAARPAASFERYPGDNASVPFSARLTMCDVRGLTFRRPEGDSSLSVNVSLTGYRADDQAPTVYVALYDENGAMLAQEAIVRFVSAELKAGETREVEDTMDYPKGAAPVFVGVNEGGASPPAASPTTAALPPSPVADDGADYREAMAVFKEACSREGYTVIWPHEGDDDAVGVIVDDGAYGATTAESKKALAKVIAEKFSQMRRQNGRPGPYKAFIRYVPSGDVVSVQSAGE